MLEEMDGEATPSPIPERTRATSTRAMPVFRPVRAKTPIEATTQMVPVTAAERSPMRTAT